MKRFALWLGLIALLALVLRVYGVRAQPALADEVQVAHSADNYVERGQFGPTMPNHPNLRNVLVSWSLDAFGRGAIGLRFWSLLLGTLSVPLLGLLVWRLTDERWAGLVAALLLALDPVHITFSRQAIQEVHTTFFFLAGCALFAFAYAGDRLRRPWLVAAAGVAFGLGVASKGHALFPLAVCGGVGLWRAWRVRAWEDAALTVSALALLPFAVFVLTYLPWFERGYGFGDWWFMQGSLAEMTVEHAGYANDLMLDNQPWQWFVRPLMGYANFTVHEGAPYVTIAVGNPLVWLAVLPAAVMATLRCRRGEPGFLLLLLFAATYLPLVASPRPFWLLSSLATTPFAFGLVALAVARLRPRVGTKAVAAYLGAVALATLLLYPATMGEAARYDHLSPLTERMNPHEHDLLRGP